MNWGYYTDLHPDALAAIQKATPIAYLPWGALEWHGPHLPLGVDGIIAQAMAERMIKRTGGVLFPTTWWPVTPVPHQASVSIRGSVVRALWDDIFIKLVRAEWKIVVLVNCHYAQGHELLLIESAEEAINQYGLLVLAVPSLAMIDPTMLDHAGLWETSLMMALRPDLVNLQALGAGRLKPSESGIVGKDPRGTATPGLGKHALNIAVEWMVKAIEQLVAEQKTDPLTVLYQERRAKLQAYVEQYYRGSLEEANQKWWKDVTGGEE